MSIYRPQTTLYVGAFGATHYCINRDVTSGHYYVSDDCGATWGDFATTQEAMTAVENLQGDAN